VHAFSVLSFTLDLFLTARPWAERGSRFTLDLFDQIKVKMDNSKMIYSEEGLDINKQQNAKMKIADLMLLQCKMFEVKKNYGSYCTLKNKAKKEKIENGKYTL